VLGLGLSGSAKEPAITTFDAPGAGTGAGQGTVAFGINAERVIVGYYCDASNCHDFLRAKDGSFTTFDPPAGTVGYVFTFAYGVNTEGAVAGDYYDASSVYHGFLRAPDGTFTTFEAPGAATT